LKIYHPYRSLYGFIADMQTKQLATSQQLEQVWQSGLQFIHRSLLTDLQFIYSPSQIALGAILATGTKIVNILNYLNSCFPEESSLPTILINITAIAKVLSFESPTIDSKQTENIIAKLYNYATLPKQTLDEDMNDIE